MHTAVAHEAPVWDSTSHEGAMLLRKLLIWFHSLGFKRYLKEQGLRPHPDLTTDRGEREFAENRMELDSQHAGRRAR